MPVGERRTGSTARPPTADSGSVWLFAGAVGTFAMTVVCALAADAADA
jgi:hypothetical protein